MTREWKPGDVALVCNEFGVWNVAICTLRVGYIGYGWRFGVADMWMRVGEHEARPLAVIDPEDRRQVERLRDLADIAYREQNGDHGDIDISRGRGERGNAFQAALREFADPKPPKPDEPTGLGAVVESEDGRRWVRSKDITTVCHWKPSAGGRRVRWSDLPHVRVLSEGVAE